MTTYTWPSAQWAKPSRADLQVIDNLQRVNESPLSGYTQSLAMPGARWGWSMVFPPQTASDRDQLEALLIAMNGRANRMRLWDLKRPRPRGSIALSGVYLGSAADQFAEQLTLAGCWPADNQLRDASQFGGGFWTPAGVSVVADAVVSPDGSSTADRLIESATSDQHRVIQSITAVIGKTYTNSVHVLPGSRTRMALANVHGSAVAWYDLSSGTVTATSGAAVSSAGVEVLSGGWLRPWLSYVAVSTVGGIQINLANASGVLVYAGDGVSGLSLWGAKSQEGDLTPYRSATLLRGDWIGLPAQLVRVVDDASANESGQMTVQVRHMLRSSIASGSAVTLDRPTALYMRTESGLLMPRQPGGAEPELQCDWVEAFA